MSAAFPSEMSGIVPSDVAPQANREFLPGDCNLSPEDYFVLTRVDGATSFKQLCLISGFPEAKTLTILRKLRQAGAILLPGETPPARPVSSRSPPAPSDDPSCDLSTEKQRDILAKHQSLATATLFERLEVPRTVDRRGLKRAYFKISKEFHPDRYFGKKLGAYEVYLAEIFKALTDAYEHLDHDGRRDAYLAELGAHPAGSQDVRARGTPREGAPPKPAAAAATRVATPEATAVSTAVSTKEQAAELFDRACHSQVMGALDVALREFAAAVKLDPQARYLCRAADTAMLAKQLSSAEDYAKKATEADPRNASAHRTLAKVFRMLGRLSDASGEMEVANRLEPANAHIAAELAELEELRRLAGV